MFAAVRPLWHKYNRATCLRSGCSVLRTLNRHTFLQVPTPPKQPQLSGPPLHEQAPADSHAAKHAYNIGPIGAKPREQATGQRVATPTDQQSSRPGSTPQTPSTQQSIMSTQSSNRSPQQNEPPAPAAAAAAPTFGTLPTPPLSQERLPTTAGSTGTIGQPAPIPSGGAFMMNPQKNSMNGGAYNMWGSSGTSTILDVLRSGMVNGSSASPPSMGGSGGASGGGGWDQWSGANGPQSSWSTNGIGTPATSWSGGYNAGLPPPFATSNSRGASPANLGFDEKDGPLAELLKRATQAFPMADEQTLQSLCGHVYRQHLTARTSNAELNMNEMLQSVLKLIEQHSSGSVCSFALRLLLK